jgi:hypothetical protein
MISLKTLYPSGIQTRVFWSRGGCGVRCATPPGQIETSKFSTLTLRCRRKHLAKWSQPIKAKRKMCFELSNLGKHIYKFWCTYIPMCSGSTLVKSFAACRSRVRSRQRIRFSGGKNQCYCLCIVERKKKNCFFLNGIRTHDQRLWRWTTRGRVCFNEKKRFLSLVASVVPEEKKWWHSIFDFLWQPNIAHDRLVNNYSTIRKEGDEEKKAKGKK